MSALVLDIVNPTITQRFLWNEERNRAAVLLASGASKQETADEIGVNRSTIYQWLQYEDFCAEVDRLSVMVGIASRAERLRIAMRLVRSRINQETGAVESEKDVLDWLKFAQSETDGAKIDLSKLAELLAGESGGSDTGNGSQPAQLPPVIEVDAVESGGESSSKVGPASE